MYKRDNTQKEYTNTNVYMQAIKLTYLHWPPQRHYWSRLPAVAVASGAVDLPYLAGQCSGLGSPRYALQTA